MPTSPTVLPTQPLTDVVAQILTKSMNAVSDGAVWLQGQVPDVIHQFICWKIAESVVSMLFAIFIGTLTMFFCKKLKRLITLDHEYESSGYYNSGFYGLRLCVMAIGGFTAIMVFGCGLMKFLELIIAPKLYLLEYVANLYRNSGH